ncbi:FUSC family protein [Caballeronia sp. HLA56]
MTALSNRYRRIDRFDALRICLQSLFASALAYACMKLMGSTSLTWAVFSSLFTLQANFDRSLKHGIGQMIGAVAGTVVGLATLHVFPDAGDAILRLGVATLATCLLSSIFPTTNYSIVVAAAIALEPSAGFAGAISRAEAIVLGSAIGIVVSVSVWPQLARSRAFGIMGDLIDDCRALLHALPILSAVEDRASVDALHERFLRHLVDARAVSSDARVKARFRAGPTLSAALTAFETLWHGLVLLDRVGESQCRVLPEDERKLLRESVNAVGECASGYLEQLAAYLRDGAALPPSEHFLKPLGDASASVKARFVEAAERRDEASQQLQALATLLFALEQIEANLRNIGWLLETRF